VGIAYLRDILLNPLQSKTFIKQSGIEISILPDVLTGQELFFFSDIAVSLLLSRIFGLREDHYVPRDYENFRNRMYQDLATLL
jgi:hypothetical protein